MTELEKYFYKKKIASRIGVNQNNLGNNHLVNKAYYKLYDQDQDNNDKKLGVPKQNYDSDSERLTPRKQLIF